MTVSPTPGGSKNAPLAFALALSGMKWIFFPSHQSRRPRKPWRSRACNTAKMAQDWIAINSSEFISGNGLRTRLTSAPLDYTMSEELCLNATFQTKPENIDLLNKFQQQNMVPAATGSTNVPKRLQTCVSAGGGLLKYMLKWTTGTYQSWIFLTILSMFLTTKITLVCLLFRAKLKLWHKIFK